MNKMYVFFIFLFSYLFCIAEEVPRDRNLFHSPDKKYTIFYCTGEFIYEELEEYLNFKNERFSFSSISLYSQKENNILWTGYCYYDISAHSFEAFWSPNSDKVIMLYRPSRAEISIIYLEIRNKQQIKTKIWIKELNNIIADEEKKYNETDSRSLVKVWFNDDWKWGSDSSVTGSFISVKDLYHKYFLQIKTSKEPILKLLNVKSNSDIDDL